MNIEHQLERFIKAQERDYPIALSEIKKGQKQSHWMWYIFPQIKGLGHSSASMYYAIKDLEEANAYLAHPLLRARLTEICEALLHLESKDAYQIFGSPDDVKLKSSMTLFASIPKTHPAFQKVLDKYFGGTLDQRTLALINK